MLKTLEDYAVFILTIVGSCASIISLVQLGSELGNQGVWGVVFLGFIAIIFIFYNFYLISRFRKKVKYGEIFEELNIGFSQLHNISRHLEPSTELIIQRLTFLCDSISNAFTKINGHHIGVCIKFLTFENDRPLVKTLVRDSKSKANGRKTGTHDTTKHWLEGNSDFEHIYTNFDNDDINTAYYYEPNLPVCRDYKNTRLRNKWLPENRRNLRRIKKIRRVAWPLKYKSTLVTPIVPLLADEQEQTAIRGFLCIDSPRENTFFEEIDPTILRGICDGLYNKIDQLNKLNKLNKE